MVTLFTGLYAAAGIGAAKASPPSTPRAARAAQPRRQMTSKSGSGSRTSSHGPPPARSINGVPEPLAGLLTRLPVEGKGWTQESRDKFVATFGTLLDFCFPIVERVEEPDDEQEGDE